MNCHGNRNTANYGDGHGNNSKSVNNNSSQKCHKQDKNETGNIIVITMAMVTVKVVWYYSYDCVPLAVLLITTTRYSDFY